MEKTAIVGNIEISLHFYIACERKGFDVIACFTAGKRGDQPELPIGTKKRFSFPLMNQRNDSQMCRHYISNVFFHIAELPHH